MSNTTPKGKSNECQISHFSLPAKEFTTGIVQLTVLAPVVLNYKIIIHWKDSHYLKAFFQMFSVFLQYYLCIDCLINVVSLQRSQAIQKYGSSHVLLKPIRDTWNRPHHVYITIHIKNALEYLQQAYMHCQKCQHYWDLIAKTFNVNKRHYLGWVVLTTNTGIKK